MKLHVVFDGDGTILAAAHHDAAAPVAVRPMPDEKHGERSAQVDLPEGHEPRKLAELVERMVVADRGDYFELVTRERDAES